MASGKYGAITTAKVPGNPFIDDEPLFLLPGRDAAAVKTIRHYRLVCQDYGSPQEHLDSISEAIETFRDWQTINADVVKVPD